MRAVIIGNGDIKDYQYIKSKINDNDFIICADGGYNHAEKMGIVPDVLIGDFDSAKNFEKVKDRIEYPKRKDFTDGELAVAYAVSMLKSERVEKIILTRPAVEAGESLGFLPGDMKEKVDPYLRPLYDALNEMLGLETVEKYVEKQVIEIAPLAFMRGRTLNDAIVILDEAQNATCAQMKMFLTRMGKNCKMVVTGDVTQIDLIKKKDSGLMQACTILDHIDGISIIHLENSDVVRNPLVQKIIERYAKVE